jgi:hypothetical protein
MSKSQKILIGVLVGIALVNFYLQHKNSQKLDEIKKEINGKTN